MREANRRYLTTYLANSKLMVIWENVATIVPEWGEDMGFVLKAEGYENAFYKK